MLVIDAGEIKEFDHSYNLIGRADSFFKRSQDQADMSQRQKHLHLSPRTVSTFRFITFFCSETMHCMYHHHHHHHQSYERREVNRKTQSN